MAAMLRRLWGFYLKKLDESPILTKALTAASLTAAGDVLAQTLIEKKPKEENKYDPVRTARMASVGLFISGPLMHFWYGFLHKALPAITLGPTVAKIALDQTLFAPIVVSSFLTVPKILEGNPPGEMVGRLQEILPSVMKVNWTIWPAAMLINFKLIPPAQSVLYVSGVALCWNTYLSLVANRDKHPSEKH